jgi:hypothetical protein
MLIRQLTFIFYALVAGQVIFAGVCYFLLHNEMFVTQDIAELRLVVPIAVVGAMAISYFLNEQMRQKASTLKSLEAQAAHYKQRVILRLAVLEGANLFALVAYLMTGSINFMLFFAVGLLLFFYFRPNEAEMERDYV